MTAEKNEEGHVHYDLNEHGIATISFFHPSHNSLPGYLLNKLADTISEAGNNEAVKVIILKSDGDRTFCAGASFDELIAIKNEEEGYTFFSGFAKVINACRQCPKIIIGRVQGKAIGGGVGVAASSDYCFASTYASIKLSELAIGIGPFVVGPAIERKIGKAAFAYLALNPKTFASAAWGKENGLYNDVCESTAMLNTAVQSMALALCDYNPEALSGLKQSFWRGTEDWDVLLAERAKMSGKLILSDFAKKAIEAFKQGAR